ncbi:glycosyl hydrolase family 18 protein [Streptomyces sp. NPDC051940]|uniref:glycosyl hydrolase family 18 protein n=1 Tax=Streptomyces sp. NPDC051940 TaxID=3155675 RepID=UPI0034454533
MSRIPHLPRAWKAAVAAGATTLAALAGLLSPAAHAAGTAAAEHRTLAYYQTQYQDGVYVSPLPLKDIATHIEVAALHLNGDGSVHLNDHPPTDPRYDRMWTDIAELQASGTKSLVLLGGAAPGTYTNLHKDFPRYYGLLKETLQRHGFDGVDLDIEERFSLADTERLIRQLRADFGDGFIITLTPVASDLSGGSRFSGGFSYKRLEQDLASDIDWYTGQFYCGWGSLGSTSGYDAIVANGFSPSRVLTGALTNPANCSGYVDPGTLASTLRSLVAAYPTFAGAAGWEYFNAVPVNGTGPASWYANVAGAMSS